MGCPAILGSEAQTPAWFPGAPALGLPSQPQLYDAGPKLAMLCARPAAHHQKRKALGAEGNTGANGQQSLIQSL